MSKTIEGTGTAVVGSLHRGTAMGDNGAPEGIPAQAFAEPYSCSSGSERVPQLGSPWPLLLGPAAVPEGDAVGCPTDAWWTPQMLEDTIRQCSRPSTNERPSSIHHIAAARWGELRPSRRPRGQGDRARDPPLRPRGEARRRRCLWEAAIPPPKPGEEQLRANSRGRHFGSTVAAIRDDDNVVVGSRAGAGPSGLLLSHRRRQFDDAFERCHGGVGEEPMRRHFPRTSRRQRHSTAAVSASLAAAAT